MPKVDAPYVIGVIREKEKGFLEDDEYTRLIQAPTPEEAVRTLLETPYGVHYEREGSPLTALNAHLQEELAWLRDTLDKEEVIFFITARYDALNIARALTEYHNGSETLGDLSPLGSIPAPLLYGYIWHGEGFADLPGAWQRPLSEEKEKLGEDTWSKTELLKRMHGHLVAVMEKLAVTPMMERIADMIGKHFDIDAAIRNRTSSHVQEKTDEAATFFTGTPEVLEAVRKEEDATQYEKYWDEQLIYLLREHRNEPIGFDPIVGYWYGKELEAKTLRLLLSAKLGGLPQSVIESLRRPLYMKLV